MRNGTTFAYNGAAGTVYDEVCVLRKIGSLFVVRKYSSFMLDSGFSNCLVKSRASHCILMKDFVYN